MSYHHTLRRLLGSGALVALTAGLLVATPAQALAADRPAARMLDRVLARQYALSPKVPGIAARVDAPGLRWAGALGASDRATGSPLAVGDTFRIASVTKTFTAAAVLALVDRRKVGLDAAIAQYLPQPYPRLLRRGGYRPDQITVRQLLTHTSGLYDYATDDRYVQTVLADLQRRWTPAEQVGWAMTQGSPYGGPGDRFRYSDTGYVLLARIVESVTHAPQAVAYRRLLGYDRLGLHSTWFETLEPAPRAAGPRAHQYFIDAGSGLDLDTYAADPSFDLYGGGGLVSSVSDLTRFYRALFDGRVISAPALRAMLTLVPVGHGDSAAGMGIFPGTVAGTTCWWHNGFWGSAVLYCPDHRLAVAVTINAYSTDDSAPGAMTDAAALATAVIQARPRRAGPIRDDHPLFRYVN